MHKWLKKGTEAPFLNAVSHFFHKNSKKITYKLQNEDKLGQLEEYIVRVKIRDFFFPSKIEMLIGFRICVN